MIIFFPFTLFFDYTDYMFCDFTLFFDYTDYFFVISPIPL